MQLWPTGPEPDDELDTSEGRRPPYGTRACAIGHHGSSFDTVNPIAQGIAEHGEAYAAWVSYVGDTSGELLEPERFQDHYLGE